MINYEKNIIKFEKKVRNIIKSGFDSEPVYNEKYLKAEINCCNGKINKMFCNNETPKEGSQFISVSVISVVSNFRTSKSYYPQVFLEESKYVVKEKKI